MPPARPLTRRAVTNENDENGTVRLTRAKAAALGVSNDAITKKPLMAKKSATNVLNTRETGLPRKRAALGDVSNVNKGDFVEVKEGKKPLGGGLLSKAAHPIGIQKASTNTTRSILTQKDKINSGNDLKRPASVNGVVGGVTKKRSTTSSSRRSVLDESPAAENVEPNTDDDVKVVITETTKVTTRRPDGTEMAKEVKREEKVIQISEKERQRQRALEKTVEAMDEEDHGDPLMVSEYVYEILDYMKELENTTMPNANYMDHQEGMEWRMRGVLIDWLLEVHTRFHLLPETFYLTVNIIDRFLSSKLVQLERLQLVGITAMFVASKYEEVLSPHIGNFRHVADDGFTEAEILSAERFILQTLNYDLSYPNPMHFMRRISKADNYDIQTRTVAKYLLEITLLDHRFLEFKPSVGAAASMHLARMILGKGTWTDVFVHYSGYTEEEITPCVETMITYLREPVVHNAFYKKYAGKKFLKASLHARAWAKKYSGDLLDQATGGQSP